jgi:hypothetical protein
MRHPAADAEAVRLDHRDAPDRPDREDGALGRIDDRGELGHVVHAQVGDRERRAGHLLRAELARPRALREIAGLGRDLGEALA